MTQDEKAAVAAIIDAFYDLLSGADSEERDWPAVQALFCPGASICVHTRGGESGPSGAVGVEAYVERLRDGLSGRAFFERGLDYQITISKNLAQVWSRYEASDRADYERVVKTGTNLIHFVCVGGTWRIAGMIYEDDPTG